MVKAIVLVKSPKKLIAARLKQVNLVYESFPVSGQFDAVAAVSYTHQTLPTICSV